MVFPRFLRISLLDAAPLLGNIENGGTITTEGSGTTTKGSIQNESKGPSGLALWEVEIERVDIAAGKSFADNDRVWGCKSVKQALHRIGLKQIFKTENFFFLECTGS